MKRKHLIILFLISLFLSVIASTWIAVPGYMDAEYYYSTGLSLHAGIGFREEFLWNYLNDPNGLPTPSHQYWMPATSVLSALSMAIFGEGFRAAQLPFILLTALIAPITALLAYKLHQDQRLALISGLLAIFPGFYLPFLLTTDTFSIYMILGTAFFWGMANAIEKQSLWLWVLVGGLAGIAHLSRADGLLLLGVAGVAVWIWMKGRAKAGVALFLGYILIMLPWWLHNLAATGAIMSPNSTKVLWTLSYDELFSFPAEKLTFQRWWSAGIGELLSERWRAGLTNLQSLVLVNGLVFLGPFMAIGARKMWRLPIVRMSVLFLVSVFLLMSVVFPFAGARGGFFHSSSAVMPILWALAPIGLVQAINLGVERRGWDLGRSIRVFASASVLLALLTTIGIFYTRVIGYGATETIWSSSHAAYQAVDSWFDSNDPGEPLIAINNPPGFQATSGRKSVVIPDGGTDQLLQVVKRYEVEWVVLDMNNPGLAEVFEDPDSIPWLVHESTLEPIPGSKILIFRVNLD